MAKDDNELDRLRQADPVASESLPSADSPRARALFEEITMTDPITNQPSPIRTAQVRWIAGIAAAGLLIAGGVAVTALRGEEPPRQDPQQQPQDSPNGPVSPGSGMAMCVETYEPATLARREMAFDGTVDSIEGDSVTFTVNRAYRGVESDRVTLQGAQGLTGLTSVGPSASVEPGSRLLVAGDGGFAWSCGFTQPYDPAVAAEWETTFAS